MSTPSVSTSQRPYPLSPPPHIESKRPQEVSIAQPQTPQSPPQRALGSTERTSPIELTGQAIEKSFPTPANSINGRALSSDIAEMSMTMADNSQDVDMETEDSSNKRKREIEDVGDQEQKKVHVEDRRLGIEDLHLDVGKKYLLCRTPHPRIQPNLSQDLFNLYSLNDIANQVARTLPNGEKNKLRKTYKGKIKDLGISGKFDVVAREDDAPDSFMAMLRQPEEEWAIQNRQGKEIENGLSSQVRVSLPIAMTMSKGTVPKTAWDSSVLGELDLPETKVPSLQAPPKPLMSGTTIKSVNAPAVQQRSASTKTDIARPKRNVKKRGYEESSFEGYGEGYVDDDMVDAGYSTAEGDDRGLSQKRRKKSATSHGFAGPMRHNSYGPGMVGA